MEGGVLRRNTGLDESRYTGVHESSVYNPPKDLQVSTLEYAIQWFLKYSGRERKLSYAKLFFFSKNLKIDRHRKGTDYLLKTFLNTNTPSDVSKI